MMNDKRDVIDWLNDVAEDKDWTMYYSESERQMLAKDALSLLKAQQAKLMTLEDIMEIYNARDCHLWPYDTAPYIFVEEHPDIHTYHGSWTAWREIMAILHDGIFVHTRNT